MLISARSKSLRAYVISEEANLVQHCQLWCPQQIRNHKVLLPVRSKNIIHFSWNVSMHFRKIKTVMFRKVVNRDIFCPYFSSFRADRKSMLKIPKINVLVDMILQTMDKTVSYLRKTHFFFLGHVTLSVSWLRHQAAYICTLNLLSEFDREVMSSYGQLNFP